MGGIFLPHARLVGIWGRGWFKKKQDPSLASEDPATLNDGGSFVIAYRSEKASPLLSVIKPKLIFTFKDKKDKIFYTCRNTAFAWNFLHICIALFL